MAKCFVDLSWSQRGDYVVAGAYIASEMKWGNFERDWTAVLAEAGVKAFHATDFYAGRGEFAHITPTSERHIALAQRFTGVAAAHAGYGFATGFHRATFNSVVGPALDRARVPHNRLTAEMLLVGSLLAHVASRTLAPFPGLVAEVVVEEGTGMGSVITYLEMHRSVPTNILNLFTSFSRGAKTLLPLQAADLFTHEAWRDIERIARQDPRPRRKSLQALLGTTIDDVSERGEIMFADEEILAREAARLAELIANDPRYSKGR